MQPILNGRMTTPTQPDSRQALRIAALQAAAAFAAGKALNSEVSTADVLKVAAAFQKWLEQAEPR